MTEVNIHHGAQDPIAYACRLLQKAYLRGTRVTVCGDVELLRQLDVALWTFDATAFVPHASLRSGAQRPARLAPTPIWLVDRPDDAPEAPVLVNLGPEIAPGFESFERLFEIVGSDDASRQAGRQRWRYLQSRGYEIRAHECR